MKLLTEYNNLTEQEKEELLNLLFADGYTSDLELMRDSEKNVLDHEWDTIIKKLAGARLRMTLEEEKIIKSVAKRL
jgi:hypothetical protein